MWLMNMCTHVQIAFSPKLICRFNKIPIKILVAFLREIDKLIQFIRKVKNLAKIILEKKKPIKGTPLPALKPYYRTILIKTV